MSPPRPTLLPLLLLLAFATSASAQEDRRSRAESGAFAQGFDQTVYKGLVGNVLDVIPMEPSRRVDLQRANAVVSNTLFGRSLAAWAGLSNPVLLVGGLIWGMWAASNIKPAEVGIRLAADPDQSGAGAATQARIAALLAPSTAADDAPARSGPEPMLVSAISTGDSDSAAPSPAQVIKIWLPNRSHMLPR